MNHEIIKQVFLKLTEDRKKKWFVRILTENGWDSKELGKYPQMSLGEAEKKAQELYA